MEQSLKIGARRIGVGRAVYIIAELSANHRQSFDEAARLVAAAAQCGADAVKVQTYTPDTITIDHQSELFRCGDGLWQGRMLYDLYQEAHMPWEWQPKLKVLAEEQGLDFFSTAFDPTAVDFLEKIGVPAHKIASFELVDIPLIEQMASTGKPLILSTGMASLGEIEEAVRVARRAGATQMALLKCTSAYPAQPEDMHVRTIPHMSAAFGLPVGLSDHTLGIAVPVAAVSLGACIVEKHFTLSRANPSPDSGFSLEPDEFRAMVEAIRVAEQALGTVRYGTGAGESAVRRRSLFAVQGIKAGDPFTQENVRSIRPGHGLHPRYLKAVLGRRAARDIERGTPLDWSMVGRGD